MNRRKFLASLLAAPVALPAIIPTVSYFFAPKGGWPSKIIASADFDTANMRYKATERFSVGHSDWRGIYGSDGIALTNVAHPMSAAAFRATVLSGLNKVFEEAYANHPINWEEAYHPQLTLFDSLSPDSLEEMEIEIGQIEDSSVRFSDRVFEEKRVATFDALPAGPGKDQRQHSKLLSRLLGIRKGSS